MKTIAELKEDIRNLTKKCADIDAQAATEGRELNEAEIALKNEIMDEVEGIQKLVATQERQARITASLDRPAEPVTRPAARSVQVGAPRERFTTLGEQLAAVRNAAAQGGVIDQRLFAATGLNETVTSDGGFLVQTDFSSQMLQDLVNSEDLANRCRRVTISGNANSMKMNGVDETSRASTRSGGVLGYWKAEAAQYSSSKPKFREIELNLHKLIGLCYATDELLSDAAALEGFIRQAFVEEFRFQRNEAIINGTGSGQPLGILNAGCLVSVTKESGQKADTIVAENIVKMYSRMFASSRSNAVWLINQDVEPQLFTMSLAVGTGGVPIYMPAGGLSGQPYGTLFGRPVIAIENCPTLGDVGDIIFADLNGYILAEKGGIESAMSIHVKFDYDESVFRFTMRVDGQPVRASALTPAKGSNTQSHFIALAARA